MDRRNFLGMGTIVPSLLLSNRAFLDEVLGITTVRSFFGEHWKQWKTVYKFTQNNGKSSFGRYLPQEIVLKYEVGKTVIPKIGKIFALSDHVGQIILEEFIDDPLYRVFQCKSNSTEKIECNVMSNFSGNLHKVQEYWGGKLPGDCCASNSHVAVFCDSLKVIKELR